MNLLSWFRSYLTDRLHMTVIDGLASSLLPISSGVLGPLLLKIYINSAPSVTDAKTAVQLYADDMKCYRVIDNGADTVQLQRDLLSLTGWSSEHFMNFNASKCKQIVMTKKKSFMHTSYNLSRSQVEVISIEKDLGIHVSSSLSWNYHVDLVISKAK